MRGKGTVVKLVALVLVSLAAAAPSSAFHADAVPVALSDAGLARGWLSLELSTDGSEHAIDIEGAHGSGPLQIGIVFYDDDERPTHASIYTAFPREQGALTEIGPVDEGVRVDAVTTSANGLRVGVTFNGSAARFVGTHKAIAWWAGEAVWSYAVRARAGTSVRDSARGSLAFLYTARDLTSAVHGQAYVDGIGGRVQVEGARSFAVGDTLVGYYQAGIATAQQLSMSTPKGEHTCGAVGALGVPAARAACGFFDVTGSGRAGAGTYTLRSTGAGAGYMGSYDGVWFGGADARLPG